MVPAIQTKMPSVILATPAVRKADRSHFPHGTLTQALLISGHSQISSLATLPHKTNRSQGEQSSKQRELLDRKAEGDKRTLEDLLKTQVESL